MDKYDYQIIRQGRRDDGRTWADYICTIGGKPVEINTRVRAGLDLESEIRKTVKREVDDHERREAMTPEEREDIARRVAEYRRRRPDDRDFA